MQKYCWQRKLSQALKEWLLVFKTNLNDTYSTKIKLKVACYSSRMKTIVFFKLENF